jgi:hypothetical protein
VTALFRHARNLKYNGPRYERPWRVKVQKPGTGGAVQQQSQVREIRVARLQTMYGFGNKQQEQEHHLKQQLEQLKVSELKRCVIAAGTTDEELDEIDDSDDPKGLIVTILLENAGRARAEQEADNLEAQLPQVAQEPTPAPATGWPPDLSSGAENAIPGNLSVSDPDRRRALSSPRSSPRSPARSTRSRMGNDSPRDEFVDDLLQWADGIDNDMIDGFM